MNSIMIICVVTLVIWTLWLNRGIRFVDAKGVLYYALGLSYVGLQLQLSLFDLVVYFESLFWLYLFLIRKVDFRKIGIFVISSPLVIYWGAQIHYLQSADISSLGFVKVTMLLAFVFSRVWVLLRDFGQKGYLYFPLNLLIIYTVLLPFYNFESILLRVLWPMLGVLFLTLIVEFKGSVLRRHLYLFIFLIFSFDILSNSHFLLLYFYPMILILYYLIYLNDNHKTYSKTQAAAMSLMVFYPGEYFLKTALELLRSSDAHIVKYLIVWIVFIVFWIVKVDIIIEIKKKLVSGFSFDKDLGLGIFFYITYVIWSWLWF